MAVPTIEVLNPEGRHQLGQEFIQAITSLEAERHGIVDNYVAWVDNYEGNVAPDESEKPWTGASDAHIPKTATDVDIAYARAMNAAFGNFPMFLIRAVSGKYQVFATETQKLSEYLEQQEIKLYPLLSQAFLTTIKFGTAVIYVPWENHPVMYHTIDESGQFVEEPSDLYDRPNPVVIHPKDFLLPISSPNVQDAPWCGYRYKMSHAQLRLWGQTGFFYEEAADRLKAEYAGASPEGEPDIKIPITSKRYDRVQEERERTAGITQSHLSSDLDMVHIFARRDLDGDGKEEEINLHIHVATGVVARLTYSHYRHRRRPFVELHFFPRDGVWYSIGIPEMLESVQRNIDVTLRQIQDNNTVKNTQTFRATEGGAVRPGEGFHPAKIWFVRPGEEFEPLRLGDGTLNTSMSDLQLLMNEGDKRTGLPDTAAGVSEDRQTATAVLALLQEASRRMDLVIGGFRDSLAEMWMQILELYAQFKPIMEFPDESGTLVEWHYVKGETFRRRVMVKPTMTTGSLNKAVLRQELQMLQEGMIAYANTQLSMTDLYLQAADPNLKQYIGATLEGLHLVQERILQTFEFAKDTKAILPSPLTELELVNPVQPPIAPPTGGGPPAPAGGMGSPQGLLPNPGAGTAPATAPGRPGPETGIPRGGGSAAPQGAP